MASNNYDAGVLGLFSIGQEEISGGGYNPFSLFLPSLTSSLPASASFPEVEEAPLLFLEIGNVKQ